VPTKSPWAWSTPRLSTTRWGRLVGDELGDRLLAHAAGDVHHRGDHQPVGLVAHAVGDELAVDLQVVERQVLEVVGTAVEHLLEELGPARLEHLRPVVGAEAPAAHSQFDLVRPGGRGSRPATDPRCARIRC
jgi:hypothetical protein